MGNSLQATGDVRLMTTVHDATLPSFNTEPALEAAACPKLLPRTWVGWGPRASTVPSERMRDIALDRARQGVFAETVPMQERSGCWVWMGPEDRSD